jgi:hypothetical protein
VQTEKKKSKEKAVEDGSKSEKENNTPGPRGYY